MHKNIQKIKKLEGSPQVIKNLFSKKEIDKFMQLYQKLPTTVHNKKQNVIKKRWLKSFNEELENLFYEKVKNEIGDFKMDNLKDENNEDILGLFQESYNPIGLHVDAGFNLDDLVFYFVHSYAVNTLDKHKVLGTCSYGAPFICSLAWDNIVTTQFHPEKSQDSGLEVLKNFISWNP